MSQTRFAGSPWDRRCRASSKWPVRSFDELIRLGLRARHDAREVVADPHARYFGTELGERMLVPGADTRLGEPFLAGLGCLTSAPLSAQHPGSCR